VPDRLPLRRVHLQSGGVLVGLRLPDLLSAGILRPRPLSRLTNRERGGTSPERAELFR
jgi:hypothetical protein